MQLDREQQKLIRHYIDFMAGFEESNLFKDYLEYEKDFTEADYHEAVRLLSKLGGYNV